MYSRSVGTKLLLSIHEIFEIIFQRMAIYKGFKFSAFYRAASYSKPFIIKLEEAYKQKLCSK